MNHKLVISRVVLSSALLMSTIAGPAISNAATTSKNTENQTLLKTISIASKEANQDQSFSIINSFTNPLDLAKKYAPDTLEDWKKTLDQYDKTIGSTVNISYTLSEATAIDAENFGPIEISDADISSNLAVKTTAATASSPAFTTEDAVSFSVTDIQQQDNVTFLKATPVIMEDSNADMAFIKAEIELAKAVQADDSAAIKQSLSKLLEQYKQQITDWEAAE
ncbi:MAG: hypothetical protein ACE3L7_28440 [Candidatus Pristimantibacillus sp.]